MALHFQEREKRENIIDSFYFKNASILRIFYRKIGMLSFQEACLCLCLFLDGYRQLF